MDFGRLPGGLLIREGLEDLAAGRESEASLLVLIGWRESTIDIDLQLVPDRDELLRGIAELRRTEPLAGPGPLRRSRAPRRRGSDPSTRSPAR